MSHSTLVKAVVAGVTVAGLGALAYVQCWRPHHRVIFTNGTKVEDTAYKGRHRHGPSTQWFPNGTVAISANYRDDQLDGDFTRNYPSGKPSGVCQYRQGKIWGEYKTFHENGQPFIQATYRDGRCHGRLTSYYEDGTLRSEVEYADGKVLRVVSLRDQKGRDCVLGDGELTVWKVAKTEVETAHGEGLGREWVPVYVRLTVPADAKRVTPASGQTQYKARVEFARVEEIFDRKGNRYQEAVSAIWGGATYKVGEVVRPNGFNPDIQTQCEQGIHVHLHREHCDQWPVWSTYGADKA